jgi:hypothetical protein
MKYQMALSLLAFLASGGCGGGGVTSPPSRGSTLSASAVPASSNESVARSGELHFTKECSEFHRRAGEWCTITSSNMKEIPVGTRVYYLSDAGATGADTDIILDPPGPGNNTASGHVVLSFTTLTGTVTLDGGTGKFSGIHASAVVTHGVGVNWAWDGTYSYSPPNGK